MFLSFENRNYVKVNDVYINDAKEVYICGKTYDAASNDVAFIAKLSATGVKEWEASLELAGGQQDSAEFLKLYVDGKNIWVVGQNSPNSAILAAYNPDIILCKYTEAANGLSATLTFQRGYAGISGSTRGDLLLRLRNTLILDLLLVDIPILTLVHLMMHSLLLLTLMVTLQLRERLLLPISLRKLLILSSMELMFMHP